MFYGDFIQFVTSTMCVCSGFITKPNAQLRMVIRPGMSGMLLIKELVSRSPDKVSLDHNLVLDLKFCTEISWNLKLFS